MSDGEPCPYFGVPVPTDMLALLRGMRNKENHASREYWQRFGAAFSGLPDDAPAALVYLAFGYIEAAMPVQVTSHTYVTYSGPPNRVVYALFNAVERAGAPPYSLADDAQSAVRTAVRGLADDWAGAQWDEDRAKAQRAEQALLDAVRTVAGAPDAPPWTFIWCVKVALTYMRLDRHRIAPMLRQLCAEYASSDARAAAFCWFAGIDGDREAALRDLLLYCELDVE
jgi:hypothetical protein